MLKEVPIEFRRGTYSALRRTREEFVNEMPMVAVVKWHRIGLVFWSRPEELAGACMAKFSLPCSVSKCPHPGSFATSLL